MTRRGRTCAACGHPQREALDRLLLGGQSVRAVGSQFRLPKSSVARHKANCLKRALTAATQARLVEEGSVILSELRHLQKLTLSIVSSSLKSGDRGEALRGIAQATSNLALMAKLMGAGAEPPRVQTSYTIIFEGGRPVTKVIEAEARSGN